MGKVGISYRELKLDLRMAVSDLLPLRIEQPGWYYPIFRKFGDGKTSNLSLPDAMGWKEDFVMKVFQFAGLAKFRNPHGWQVQSDEWTKLLT
jgi:hypothetical protein